MLYQHEIFLEPSVFPRVSYMFSRLGIAERPGVASAGHAVPRSSAVDSGGHLLSALAQGRVTWEIDGRAFWGILGLENGK